MRAKGALREPPCAYDSTAPASKRGAMRRILATMLLVAAATVPALADDPAQTPGSNITVTQCQAKLDKPPLKIGYSNTAPQTATEVDFTVHSSAGIIQTVKDTGKFATGTPITHVFDLPENTSPLGLSSARCTVTKVVYANGTTWVNPSPP